MARVHVRKIEEAEGLNLTPIMNMVLVLIPLMLLNVVFMTITVIEVTMPQRAAGAAQNNGEPPKRLQLFISKQGFTIMEGTSIQVAKNGCPEGGPTICLSNPEAELDTDKHDWLSLYNALMEIKMKPDWQDHEQIEIVADSSVNFGVLVKAMDISRYQLVGAGKDDAVKGEVFNSVGELNESRMVMADGMDENGNSVKMGLGMFPVVVLGLPTVTQ